MPAKKDQILQEHLTNALEWSALVNAPGQLVVVDCYPKWTGQCKSIVSTLKRIKLEVGCPFLKFATACVDDIHSLSNYRNQPPEPLFLFYASGVLVDLCHGCDVPLLNKKILKQVENETQIAAGMAVERKAFIEDRPNTAKSCNSYATLSDSVMGVCAVGSSNAKQLSFAFITPEYIDHTDEIKDILKSNGIEVLAERQHQLSAQEMLAIYPDMATQANGTAFVDYATSMTSHIMVLTREGELGVGIIDQMVKLIGAGEQEQAKIESPNSINAKFGNMTMFTSSDAAMANRAINLLFEDFAAPNKTASQSASCTGFTYCIYGPCSDSFQTQLQNYGCQIVQGASAELADKQKSNIPEAFQASAAQCMLVNCVKSLDSMQNFCQSSGDEGVYVAVAGGDENNPLPAPIVGEGD